MDDKQIKYIVQPIEIDESNYEMIVSNGGCANIIFKSGYGFISKEDAMKHNENLKSKGINAVLIDIDAVMLEVGKEFAQNEANKQVTRFKDK